MHVTTMGYNYDRKQFAYVSSSGTIHNMTCGECFDVKIKNRWYPTRIEMAEFDGSFEWYLCGVSDEYGKALWGRKLAGRTIRI